MDKISVLLSRVQEQGWKYKKVVSMSNSSKKPVEQLYYPFSQEDSSQSSNKGYLSNPRTSQNWFSRALCCIKENAYQ